MTKLRLALVGVILGVQRAWSFMSIFKTFTKTHIHKSKSVRNGLSLALT